MFARKLAIQIHTPKPEDKEQIFRLAANPENFYTLINTLNVSDCYSF
jgi:hypothetical protein